MVLGEPPKAKIFRSEPKVEVYYNLGTFEFVVKIGKWAAHDGLEATARVERRQRRRAAPDDPKENPPRTLARGLSLEAGRAK